MIALDPGKANLDFTTGMATDGKQDVSGGLFSPHTLASYFGRLSYNYAERYMAQFTIRRDGSSNFGPNNKWGTFPSVSLGWNVTNEKFMENVWEWFSKMKLHFELGVRMVTRLSVHQIYCQCGVLATTIPLVVLATR